MHSDSQVCREQILQNLAINLVGKKDVNLIHMMSIDFGRYITKSVDVTRIQIVGKNVEGLLTWQQIDSKKVIVILLRRKNLSYSFFSSQSTVLQSSESVFAANLLSICILGNCYR